jgi:hypothetical protein
MVLLKSVVEISARPMPHMFAEVGSDSSGIGVMSIGGDPIWSDAGHRLGRSKECPGSSKVTMLAQHDVNQGAVAIDRAIEIPPSAPHPDIRLGSVSLGAIGCIGHALLVVRIESDAVLGMWIGGYQRAA